MPERDGGVPREVAEVEVRRAQLQLKAGIAHTTEVLEFSTEARRPRDILVEEEVRGLTSVVVEGDSEALEETEVYSEVEGVVLFPREARSAEGALYRTRTPVVVVAEAIEGFP